MRSLTTYPVSSRTPKARMTTAAPTSMPRMASKPNPARLRTKRPAQALAPTASVAMTATVIAVMTRIAMRAVLVGVIMPARVWRVRMMVIGVRLVMRGRHRGADCSRLPEREQLIEKRAPIHPKKPRADEDDQRIAGYFYPAHRARHGRRGRVEQSGRDRHQRHCDQPLQQRR